ncbi:hypothetical protein ASG43_02040 [Aureimonas sp. Leaf454]|uniref:PAS domain-containing sensor histidine kinase n=1 Tax=Aureimonas sp. Leaf454 TaxID=1736381 RepID=UPI0007153556|nr:ATP-binding protein [Aureimonas sp. Leaf454]KQT54408.1 hypothetical protein ASG43_02040 [Aureimonas sp. Leaf454]
MQLAAVRLAHESEARASAGHGMVEAIAAHDWSKTALGPYGEWPIAAATMIAMLVESSQPMFLLWGAERTLVYNDAYAPLLGFKHPHALGLPFLDVWKEALESLKPLVDGVFAGGSHYMDHIELKLDRGEGLKDAYFAFSYNPVRNGDGTVGGLLCVCTEKTSSVLADRQRLRMEERLRESEDNYRHAVELNPQVSWTADHDGRISNVSERWLELTGRTGLGETWADTLHPDDFGPTLETWAAAIKTGHAYGIEHRCRLRSGEYRWFQTRAFPRRDAEGRIIRWYGSTEDIHDRKVGEERIREIQAELLHMSRYTALGEMASSLAHELNQPLTAVANYLSGCKVFLDDPAPDLGAVGEAVGEAANQALRAGEIIRSLRSFVSRTEGRRQSERLGEIVQEACALAMIGSKHVGIDLDVRVDPDLHVFVDRIQIQQVLLNLMRNAMEAMTGRAERRILITASASECNAFKEIVVEDKGGGIDPAIFAKLFQPFQTTKPNGMGVGLSICRTIVEAHGGRITAQSVPGVGTTFRITLPRL